MVLPGPFGGAAIQSNSRSGRLYSAAFTGKIVYIGFERFIENARLKKTPSLFHIPDLLSASKFMQPWLQTSSAAIGFGGHRMEGDSGSQYYRAPLWLSACSAAAA